MLTARFVKSLVVAFIAVGCRLLAETGDRGPIEADDQYAVAAGHYDRQRVETRRRGVSGVRREVSQRSPGKRVHVLSRRGAAPVGQIRRGPPAVPDYSSREPQGKHAAAALFGAGEAAYLAGDFAAAKPDWTLSGKVSQRPAERLRLALSGRHRVVAGDAAAAAALLPRRSEAVSRGTLSKTIAALGSPGRWNSRIRRTRPSGSIWRWRASRAALGRRGPVPSRRPAIRPGRYDRR